MMQNDTITAQQACTILGYNARSSLTRLVQAGKITPVFKASGQSGEEFFSRADVQALLTPSPFGGDAA